MDDLQETIVKVDHNLQCYENEKKMLYQKNVKIVTYDNRTI